MYVLKESATFDWLVKAKVPEGKKKVALNFTATFNILTQDVLDELLVNPDTLDHKKFLEMALVKFEGMPVHDENGQDITDVDQRNSMIIEASLFINPLIEAYIAGAAGYRAKN